MQNFLLCSAMNTEQIACQCENDRLVWAGAEEPEN